MKYITFNRVNIKNFLSVGETPVSIDFNKGLNIITGHNKDKLDRRNGVGKSTIADSIYFSIFGNTLRELKKEHITNNITQRGCEVSLEFSVNIDGVSNNYKILRTLTPTKCYLFRDGEDITRDTIQNTTQYIQDLLNTTPEVFQNCVIMTINNATPFMAKKKLEKRKFIEGIFNLQVFSNMLSDARAEYNSVSKDLDIECAKYEEISNTLSRYHEQKENDKQSHVRAIQKLNLRLENCKKEIVGLKEKEKQYTPIDTKEINAFISKIDDAIVIVDNTTQSLISKCTQSTTMIDMLTQKNDKISNEHSTCPTCLSNLDESHKELIQEEKNRIQQQIDELKEKQKTCADKLKESKQTRVTLKTKREKLSKRLHDAQIQKHEIKNIKQQIDQLKSQQRDIEEDIRSVNTQDSGFDNLIADTNKRLEELQSHIDKIKGELAKLDIVKFVVSEEGVKSYIVKKILQLFNAKLAYYLKKMDSNCICVFNEYFEDEIVDEKGKQCSYFNFSGAERKNIDLACLFAFMDIRRLQGDVAFNFSMYDELFDSSLDERGVELVIDILKERIENYGESVIVISHRKESTKLATGEIIFLEKQNGTTVRVETPESELK